MLQVITRRCLLLLLHACILCKSRGAVPPLVWLLLLLLGLGASLVHGATVWHALYEPFTICLSVYERGALVLRSCCDREDSSRFRSPGFAWDNRYCDESVRISHCPLAIALPSPMTGCCDDGSIRAVRSELPVAQIRPGSVSDGAGWLVAWSNGRSGFLPFGHELIMLVIGRVARTFVTKSCENPRLIITQRDHTGHHTRTATGEQREKVWRPGPTPRIRRGSRERVHAHMPPQLFASCPALFRSSPGRASHSARTKMSSRVSPPICRHVSRVPDPTAPVA